MAGVAGDPNKNGPWRLATPAGGSAFEAWRDARFGLSSDK